jgi:hypothetical protein
MIKLCCQKQELNSRTIDGQSTIAMDSKSPDRDQEDRKEETRLSMAPVDLDQLIILS